MRPRPEGRERFRLSEGYGHRDALAANWDTPNVPLLPRVGHGGHSTAAPFQLADDGAFVC